MAFEETALSFALVNLMAAVLAAAMLLPVGAFAQAAASDPANVATSANAGDAAAQTKLGLMLITGEGTRVDVQTGLAWLQEAAEQLGYVHLGLHRDGLSDLSAAECSDAWQLLFM
jgi:TPR repeat protein